MKSVIPFPIVLASAVMATSCHEDCSLPVFMPNLTITVRDAVTRAPLEGATAGVRDGGYVDQHLSVLGHNVSGILYPGMYTIVIRRDGYRDWTRTGLLIPRGEGCYPRGTTLDAALEPIS